MYVKCDGCLHSDYAKCWRCDGEGYYWVDDDDEPTIEELDRLDPNSSAETSRSDEDQNS